jgi:hypothetical protein
LFSAYTIKTANDNPGRDPRDWIIKCRSLEGKDIEAHTVKGEESRDRFTEKTYRLDNPIWTSIIGLEVSNC